MKSLPNVYIYYLWLIPLVVLFRLLAMWLSTPYVYAVDYRPSHPQVIVLPTTRLPDIKTQVEIDIKHVFGPYSDQALKVARCESGLNPNALNYNRDGTVDHSIFQINSVHTGRYGVGFISDWEQNIKVAYQIFKDQNGWGAWYASRRCSGI